MTLDTADDVPLWPRAGELGDKALACVFEAFWRMPDVFILAMSLVLLLEVVDGGLHGSVGFLGTALHDAFARQSHGVRLLADGGLWLARLVLIAWVAVTVHRFILLQEATSGFGPLLHRNAWAFAGWLAAIGLISAVVDFPMPWAVRLPALIPLSIVDIRSSLLFPAVAIGSADGSVVGRLRASWGRTRGRVLSLLYATIVTILPLFGVAIAVILVEFLSFAISDWPDSAQGSAISGLIELLLSSTSGVYGAMCGAAVASLAYRAALDAEARQDAVR
ncbi:MAG TPA: hypothetical protein VMU22_12730 [Rhizomicrobium sp.]|nr:hypothetical protein [Rhizomicrobium sp.]